MKLHVIKYFAIFIIFSICLCSENASKSQSTFNMQNHLAMVMKMKAKTRSMLENLYLSANRVELKNFNNFEKTNGESRSLRSKLLRTKRKTNSKLHVHTHFHSSSHSAHFSEIKSSYMKKSNLKGEDYRQFRYLNYDDVVRKLLELSGKYPDFLKINTAQKLYNLPHPGGYCNIEKKTKCEHYIAFLTNHNLSNEGKHQIYISGEVHGDERVGPTATIELIQLMLENKDHPWFEYLLNSRYIVITPMTNPHGYYDKVREELLIQDEDKMVLTKSWYKKTHKDINRDFPYLVKPQACMETIGARVVNELFIDHLFSLALSLHGGTESLTYPYGTPNHIKTHNLPKLPVSYKQNKKGRVELNLPKGSMSLIDKFRSGAFEMIVGKSTNPPDFNTVTSIAETASDHTTNNPKKKYKTGDMNGEVYSVTGGMEDWAYSGSWEGAPIITQPCKPTTYHGYNPNKTSYDKNYKDSLKSIMFLLEVSNEKVPEQKKLGRKNLNCLINLRSNAFFNDLAHNKKVCLDDYIDGYIPRIIRLSLTLIDILHPYVTYIVQPIQNNVKVTWTVGGAINVDSTAIFFNYLQQKPSQDLVNKLTAASSPQAVKALLKYNSKPVGGKGVWNIYYTAADRFSHTFKHPNKYGKYLVFIVVARVDKKWSQKNHPDPDVNPQTHIANFRTNQQYSVTNGKFTIKGQDIFKSSVKIIDTNQLNLLN